MWDRIFFMQKFSLEFNLLIVYLLCEFVLFFFGLFKVINLTLSSIISLVILFLLLIYMFIRRKEIPPAGVYKIYRAIGIATLGLTFFVNIYIMTGGVNEVILPCFIIGIVITLFATLESLGFVKTYKDQSPYDLDDLKSKSNILNFVRIFFIIWAFIPTSGAVLYSRFPEHFTFLKHIEFPFSKPIMAVSDTQGNIYIDIGIYSRIQKYDKDGRFLLGFGYGSPGNSELIIDQKDRLYVGTYHWKNTLKVFSSEGKKLSEFSEPEEDLTSWFLHKDGSVELIWNQAIIIHETAIPVKEEAYLFTSTKFYEKVFQDKKGNRYLIYKNLFYPVVYRENMEGLRDLTISPNLIAYLFTLPFPCFIIPVIIIFLSSFFEKKDKV